MRYQKRFNNLTEYNAYKESEDFILPNISVCDNELKVCYTNISKHEYVDLGLPSGTLWATENIKDANGNYLYFAWGETQGYTSGQVGTNKNFSWEDYEFGTYNNLSKYNSTDGKTVLEPEDDAATANWDSNWKMPTKEQFIELIDYTNKTWEQVDGVEGILFTSVANGNTLFFPAFGYAGNGEVYEDGKYGYYWSVFLGEDIVSNALALDLDSNDCSLHHEGRSYGYSVRPVRS